MQTTTVNFSIPEANIKGEFTLTHSFGNWLVLELQSNITQEQFEEMCNNPDYNIITQGVNDILYDHDFRFRLYIESSDTAYFDCGDNYGYWIGSPFNLVVGTPVFSIVGECCCDWHKNQTPVDARKNIERVAKDMTSDLTNFFVLYLRRLLNLPV